VKTSGNTTSVNAAEEDVKKEEKALRGFLCRRRGVSYRCVCSAVLFTMLQFIFEV